MHSLAELIVNHPFWAWVAFGAAFLAIEMSTGTGYLLWPAASAGVVAVLILFVNPGPPIELLIFALLTIAATVIGRRYLPVSVRQRGPDINDRGGRLIGRIGEVVRPFKAGQGRVFVDGSEWIAEVGEGAPAPEVGARVEIIEVLGGARLKVRNSKV